VVKCTCIAFTKITVTKVEARKEMSSTWKECVAALDARLREIGSPLLVPAALCVIYQRHVPDTVLRPPTTASMEKYISGVYKGTQVLQPLQEFLQGGVDFGSVDAVIEFHADSGEYGCNRKPADPLKAMLESAIPPGNTRTEIIQAVNDRLQTCYQRQFLQDATAAYAARERQERQIQTNAAYLVHGSTTPVPLLLTTFIGILEATGAVQKGYLSSHQILQIAHVLSSACQDSTSVPACLAAIASSLPKQHLQTLKKIGLRV
jgi:hypothetical protein